MSCNRCATTAEQVAPAAGAGHVEANWSTHRDHPRQCDQCGAFLRADGGCTRCQGGGTSVSSDARTLAAGYFLSEEEAQARKISDLLRAGGIDPLNNDGIRRLHSNYVSISCGQERQVHLDPDHPTATTDLGGTVYLNPYPLGPGGPVLDQMVVARSYIDHELLHELYTPPQALDTIVAVATGSSAPALEGSRWESLVARGKTLSPGGRAIVKDMLNILEDGRIERLCEQNEPFMWQRMLAGQAILPKDGHARNGGLARLKPYQQVMWAAQIEAQPNYTLTADIRAGMDPQALAALEELRPLIKKASHGTAYEAVAASLEITAEMEQLGLLVDGADSRPPENMPVHEAGSGQNADGQAAPDELPGDWPRQEDEPETGNDQGNEEDEDTAGNGGETGEKDAAGDETGEDEGNGSGEGAGEKDAAGDETGEDEGNGSGEGAGEEAAAGDETGGDEGNGSGEGAGEEDAAGDETGGDEGNGSGEGAGEEAAGGDETGGDEADGTGGGEAGATAKGNDSAGKKNAKGGGETNQAGNREDGRERCPACGAFKTPDQSCQNCADPNATPPPDEIGHGATADETMHVGQETGPMRRRQEALRRQAEEALQKARTAAFGDFQRATRSVVKNAERQLGKKIAAGPGDFTIPFTNYEGQETHVSVFTQPPPAFGREQTRPYLEADRSEIGQGANALAGRLKKMRLQVEKSGYLKKEGTLDRRRMTAAIKGSQRIRINPAPHRDLSMAVSLSFDRSGSMTTSARELGTIAGILSKGLERAGVPYEMRSYTEYQYHHKTFDQPKAVDEAILPMYTAGGSNDDAPAIALGGLALTSRQEAAKVQFIICDGEPAARRDVMIEAPPELSKRHVIPSGLTEVKLAVEGNRQRGQIVQAIFYAKPSGRTRAEVADKFDYMYGRGNWSYIADLKELPRVVTQTLEGQMARAE